MHLIGLNSIITAKKLYKEYIGNSDLAFRNNLLNYNYITNVAESILPNSLCYELANNINDNHRQQIDWIISQLEDIKSKAERAKLIGFSKKK